MYISCIRNVHLLHQSCAESFAGDPVNEFREEVATAIFKEIKHVKRFTETA